MNTHSQIHWCAPGIHLVSVEDDIVILNVPGDRYHCLPAAAKDIDIREDGRIASRDPEMLAVLVAAGIATPLAPETRRTGIRRAARELPLDPAPGRADILSAGLALAASTIAFRGQSLSQLISRDAAPGTTPAFDEALMGRLVGAARIARPWIPSEGECLQRAFQLRRFLARRGIAVDWVFGVRTWPFGAHCWLQSGDMLVGDRLERVGRYTPILRA